MEACSPFRPAVDAGGSESWQHHGGGQRVLRAWVLRPMATTLVASVVVSWCYRLGCGGWGQLTASSGVTATAGKVWWHRPEVRIHIRWGTGVSLIAWEKYEILWAATLYLILNKAKNVDN